MSQASPRPARIDAHHHLWKYNREEYGWMSDNMNVIRRDFLPSDLSDVLRGAGIDGAVTVQARQALEETRWLLNLADQHEFMHGVVGWVPLVDPNVAIHLDEFAGRRKFKAVRHILHDEPDDFYMLREDFNAGIRRLNEFNLIYDVLIFERHLPQTIEFVDRHPNQVFVVDHIAKPRIRDRVLSPWRENLAELAKRENVFCKVSGMVTEADWKAWTKDDLRPYFESVLSIFGPRRLMFGSDWPVVLIASSYRLWVDTVLEAVSELTLAEQDRILGGTASEVYNL